MTPEVNPEQLKAQLPELVARTQQQRKHVLNQFPSLDIDTLEAEVCNRQLIVVSGGGGGGGYGYAGAFRRLHRNNLQPELLSGTSSGALISMFRARYRIFAQLPIIETAKRLSWTNVFQILNMNSRYGIPATLRLYLREALGSMFLRQDGQDMTFEDCEIRCSSSSLACLWSRSSMICHSLSILWMMRSMTVRSVDAVLLAFGSIASVLQNFGPTQKRSKKLCLVKIH